MEVGINILQLGIDGINLFAYFLHSLNNRLYILTCLLSRRNFTGNRILFALQLFSFSQQGSSLFVQFQHLIQVKRIVTVNQVLFDFVSMFSDKFHIQHV